jgi:cell cycle checkpoint protein
MAAASKVSMRLDEEGVLNMQYLIEVDSGGAGDGVAFVDFRMVPLVDGEEDGVRYEEDDADDDSDA